VYGGYAFRVRPVDELSVLLDLLGIAGNNNFEAGQTGFPAFAFLFSLGFLAVLWCVEDGPHRPGRGVIGDDAATIFGAVVFNFFLLSGLVLGVVYWMRG
jgi:hypothetical protein